MGGSIVPRSQHNGRSYYAQQGQRHGPVAEEQLKQLASSGQLKATDRAWKNGMAAWQAATCCRLQDG